MKIVVGTKNPAKLQAVKNVFGTEMDIIGIKVPSGVSEQPFSDEETITGAINRAKKAVAETDRTLGIGLEGGVTETPFGLMLCNWGAVVVKGYEEKPFIAGGARILLPEVISERLRQGEELGPVMDEFCKKENIRSHEGAIGIFTNGTVNRDDMFTHVVKMLKGQLEYAVNQKQIKL